MRSCGVNETSIVGDGVLDVPKRIRKTTLRCEANETYCRGGACSSRNVSDICQLNAKQIKLLLNRCYLFSKVLPREEQAPPLQIY